MISTSNARYIFSRSDFRQSGTNQSTTIQSQGIIYLAVAKLRVGPAAFRLVSAYVILERARKRGVRWRVGVRHTPFAVDRSRNVSEFHRASDSRRFFFSFFFSTTRNPLTENMVLIKAPKATGDEKLWIIEFYTSLMKEIRVQELKINNFALKIRLSVPFDKHSVRKEFVLELNKKRINDIIITCTIKWLMRGIHP